MHCNKCNTFLLLKDKILNYKSYWAWIDLLQLGHLQSSQVIFFYFGIFCLYKGFIFYPYTQHTWLIWKIQEKVRNTPSILDKGAKNLMWIKFV